MRALTWVSPLGFIAVLAGWFTAEVGRQPWTVYGVLRTADAVSPVPGGSVLASLILFVLVYGIVFGAGVYYIAKLVQRGPDATPPVARRGRGGPFAPAHGSGGKSMTGTAAAK